MRLHVPSLPWFNTVRENSQCAYVNKIRRWADMMVSVGHEVVLYAGEETDSAGELVTVVTAAEQDGMPQTFDGDMPHWQVTNARVIAAMRDRLSGNDMLCVIAGHCQKVIAEAFPGVPCVEWGVGYSGTFADFRVFESYAWMHTVYGAAVADAADADGRWYDRVIPNSFERAEFPFVDTPDDYLLFVGRLTDRKGLAVVGEIAKRTDRPVLVCGSGDETLVPAGCEYMGAVGPKERAKLMGHAAVLLAPTLYVEPFGGVAAEAMMCGTPVVATDWGAFTETVSSGVSGFRCRTLPQFLRSVEHAARLDRQAVSVWAERFDTDTVRWQYEEYLDDVRDVHDGGGWYG